MERRTFLKAVGSVTSGLTLGNTEAVQVAKADSPAPAKTGSGVLHRVLGRTGQKVSTVGFPGLALVQYDQKQCNEGIRRAFERGVNYFDVAPAYGNGQAETKMGIGLEGLDRSRYFLACKTKMRDKDGARRELENSLKLLKTDYFDLYQLHHLVKPEDVRRALGPGGAIETLLKAKEEGKVKYLGFSAHSTKGALEAMKGFRFDTVMFPINFVEYYVRDFGKEVLALAEQQGAAVLAIKAISRGLWPQGMERTRKWWYRSMETQREISLAMRFALSLPGVVAGIPPSFLDLLDKTIQAAESYQPPTEAELEELKRMAANSRAVFEREDSLACHAFCHEELS